MEVDFLAKRPVKVPAHVTFTAKNSKRKWLHTVRSMRMTAILFCANALSRRCADGVIALSQSLAPESSGGRFRHGVDSRKSATLIISCHTL